MNDYTIGDVTYDSDGDMKQFLLFWHGGKPETRRATPENILLFDPEDELPFDGGLHKFLDGDGALKLSTDPKVVVSQIEESSYVIEVDGETVETTPKQSEDVLSGVLDAVVEQNEKPLVSLHRDILSNQVRRSVVGPLMQTFAKRRRIESISNGWLVDGFYLVDWNAKMYAANDDREEGDYVRSGTQAVKKDTTYEFVQLRHNVGSDEDVTVTINGNEKHLTERERLFLAKVKWLLDRTHFHPDEAFWSYCDKYADIDRNEPNFEKFSL